MATRHKVIIIDDDKLATHNWKIRFHFVGEDVASINSTLTDKLLSDRLFQEPVLAIMIGKISDSHFSVPALIDLIHQAQPKLPIFLQAESAFIRQQIQEASQPWIIQLPEHPDYQTLLRLLEYARQLLGLKPMKTHSRIISDQGTPLFRTLAGDSAVIKQVRELMHQVSARKANVLLSGESGTGKEIVARNIHYHSGRGDRAFIAVNCAAEGEQFEAHLFGKTTLTSADADGMGYLEKASGGTLFLDKITEMPLAIQARLLSFLENNSFHRVGEQRERQADVRLVVATNADLRQKVSEGRFREDLYYLLNVFPITLPPLREHTEDIPALIKELITRLEHAGQKAIGLGSSAVESLQRCAWPGNVRELTNLIERLAIIYEGRVIGVNDLPPEYRHVAESEPDQTAVVENLSDHRDTSDGQTLAVRPVQRILSPLTAENLKQYLDNFEKEILETAIQDSGNYRKLAAERLNMDLMSFDRKILKHGLRVNA